MADVATVPFGFLSGGPEHPEDADLQAHGPELGDGGGLDLL